MKKLRIILLVLILLVCLIPTSLISTSQLKVEAAQSYKGMCVLANDNKVLYEYNKDVKLPMASTTKIITAIVTLENCDDLDKLITVADESVGIEGTSIYLRKNEQISIRNLLYGLILASGNDASTALAYEIGGSEEKFVEMMNDFVKRLGLTNTQLKNPHGLDADGHYTSAYDLAAITNYALNNETFLEIVSTKTKVLNEGEPNVRYLRNKNKLLFSEEGCIGVKTGFTDNAGRCLVNACERDGMRVVSVVLNCGPMFEECDRLNNLAFNEYELKTFVEPYGFVGNVNVVDGDKNEISVATIKGFSTVIKKSEAENYRVEFDVPESVTAPISKSDEIGKVTVFYKDEIIYEDSVYSTSEIENINLKHKIDNIMENWYL